MKPSGNSSFKEMSKEQLRDWSGAFVELLNLTMAYDRGELPRADFVTSTTTLQNLISTIKNG